ncbi:hypothetical protein QA645_32345 [Bradyrhizobium sp. CIAT3101]|uniref:hypothetical protein n=1 Tax=Bradyrhizobium sp. CIAT3101 TaxID=439387 RepID=UPI0024B0C76C|nr:hypothetical protein [Bradyrhizobium sp. CIAT3101]WFU79185.1 hypothetical protein QA645_32345 [Bradyrhizobium sp. CIAT3101]
MHATIRKNRPRTKRQPLILRTVGPRHFKILTAIERYGLSDTHHLLALTGLDYRNFEAPARDLFHAGLVDRPPNKKYNRDELKDAQVYKNAALGTDCKRSAVTLSMRA